MKSCFIIFLFSTSIIFGQAPSDMQSSIPNIQSYSAHLEETAVNIVQSQLIAYNNKDIQAFTALFAEDAALFNLGQDVPIAQGKDAIYALYNNLFQRSPDLHSEVVNRSVLGNKVIDYELITGREGQDGIISIIAIYVIENSLISKCYFIRK